jgi:hypothetical protein
LERDFPFFLLLTFSQADNSKGAGDGGGGVEGEYLQRTLFYSIPAELTFMRLAYKTYCFGNLQCCTLNTSTLSLFRLKNSHGLVPSFLFSSFLSRRPPPPPHFTMPSFFMQARTSKYITSSSKLHSQRWTHHFVLEFLNNL